MDLSIITVTYNATDLIAEQIRSVARAARGLEYEHIIVDNASTDETVGLIREQFPGVCIIENTVNRGFAVPNNQGVKVAKAPLVLFLNPDMKFLEEGSLTQWVRWMREHPDVGISGCKLVTENGEVNRNATPRRFPKMWEVAAIILKIPHLFPKSLDHYLYRDLDFRHEQNVDSVRGSATLMRRELIDSLGWAFDPRYFFWFEDVDVCREAKRLGWKVVCTPIVSCLDYVGQSFKKEKFFWKQKQFIRSAVKYFLKWR